MKNIIIDITNFENFHIGSKARNLFIMKKNSLCVPDLFCIPYEYFNRQTMHCSREIRSIADNIDFNNSTSIANASEKLKKIAGLTDFDNEYKKEINDYLDRNFQNVRLFSVRSSTSVEDGAETSFAGQFDTYLNVNKEDIFKYALKCLQSAFSVNVLRYCKEKGIGIEDCKTNVIIQEMVSADISGVIFTANPQGLLNETVVVCGKGTGDMVVEDKTQTTAYYYNMTDKVYYYEKQQGSPVLSSRMLDKIIKISIKLTGIFGKYLDIEFAVKSGKIYILQARPVTTIHDENQIILDNSNIVESYPDITLPLSDSFVCEIYYRIFRGLASRCLKNEKLLSAYDGDLRQMVSSANGRMYYKISTWYAVLGFLPFSKKIIPVWQDMMGVADKEYGKYDKKISLFQNIRIYFNCLYEILHAEKGMEKLNNDFMELYRGFKDEYNSGLQDTDLIGIYNNTSDKILKNWDITLLNDIYAFIFTGLLKNKLKKLKIENYESLTNEYITGVANIESMKPVKALLDLSRLALESDSLKDLTKLKNDDEQAMYFRNNNSVFAKGFLDYIEKYGDRSLDELKLESKTFRTSPSLLADKISEYTSDRERLENISDSINSSTTIEDIKSNFNFWDKRVIAFYSRQAMLAIGNREISRLNRSRVYGMVRTLFLTIGKNMRERGQIENTEDVFYLYKNEVFNNGSSISFKETVEKRKQEYLMYRKLPCYSRLVFSGAVFNKNPSNINADEIKYSTSDLAGIPCSNGCVEGEVIVIDIPGTDLNAKDKIIVTKMTDPGWVFLITLAKGIITEKGSLLSHTAIISRELNVPSIVCVNNITNILKTGDIVKMDGNTGKIEVVRKNV